MDITLNSDIVYSPIFKHKKATHFYLYLKTLQATQLNEFFIDTGKQFINIELNPNEVIYEFDDEFAELIGISDYQELLNDLYQCGVALCLERHDFYIKFRLLMGY